MSQSVKSVSQARSAKTRDKLIAALERLLAARDFDAISVADIAKEAGVAVGTVYRRFENKEAFIPALLDAYRARLKAALDDPDLAAEHGVSIGADIGLWDALHAIALMTLKAMCDDAGLMRTLYLYSRMKPQIIGDGWEEVERASLAQIETLLARYEDEITHPDLHAAAITVTSMISTVMIEKALFPGVTWVWLRDMDGTALAREATEAAFAYLTMPRRPAPVDGQPGTR